MLILRGNSAPKGKYPDEHGNYPAWPNGALHVSSATKYARLMHFEPVVLDIPGQPQSETSPQATEALKRFLDAGQSVPRSMDFRAAAITETGGAGTKQVSAGNKHPQPCGQFL